MAIHFLNAASSKDKRVADTRQYSAIATSFLSSSREVSDPWVRLFLLYHAIECALKAYLVSENVLSHSLSRDHKITKLAKKAVSQGLVLTKEDNCSLQYFRSLSKDGIMENRPSIALRYDISGGATSESPDVLERIAGSIIKQIKL